MERRRGLLAHVVKARHVWAWRAAQRVIRLWQKRGSSHRLWRLSLTLATASALGRGMCVWRDVVARSSIARRAMAAAHSNAVCLACESFLGAIRRHAHMRSRQDWAGTRADSHRHSRACRRCFQRIRAVAGMARRDQRLHRRAGKSRTRCLLQRGLKDLRAAVNATAACQAALVLSGRSADHAAMLHAGARTMRHACVWTMRHEGVPTTLNEY